MIDATPGWVPDLADRGVIAPLDEWVTKYKAQATFADIHPLYRAMPKHKGKTWGFFDDGDMYILYYRKDIFAAKEGGHKPSSRSLGAAIMA